jgi:Flp pilus assembly protein TadG
VTWLRALATDRSGSVAIEFGLLGPLMIGMLFGVLQVGVGMQSYNALRGISGDVARYAVVNYQTANRLTNAQLQTYGTAVATGSPYNLDSNDVTVAVVDAATQRVSGATEKTFSVSYVVPSFLTVLGIEGPTISFSRPVFLTN